MEERVRIQGTRCIFADVLASPLLHTGFTSRRSSRFSIFTRLWFHFVEFVEIFRFFWSPGWYIESMIRILREEVSKLFLIFKLCFQLLVAIESIFSFFFFWCKLLIRSILIIFLNTKYYYLWTMINETSTNALPQGNRIRTF